MKVTLEQLAEKLNSTVWAKGDLKRIYLNDAGYNTKKMTTKAFVFEKDGEFLVSVKIDCPSQHYNWIKDQEEKVKDSILSDIDNAIEEILNPQIEEEINQPVQTNETGLLKPIIKKPKQEDTPIIIVGEKYSNPRFGIGICLESDGEKAKFDFCGTEKELIIQFARLEKIC